VEAEKTRCHQFASRRRWQKRLHGLAANSVTSGNMRAFDAGSNQIQID